MNTATQNLFPVLRDNDCFGDRTVWVSAVELHNSDFTALSAQDRARAVVALAAIGVAVVWSAEYGFELVDADEVEAAVTVQVAA